MCMLGRNFYLETNSALEFRKLAIDPMQRQFTGLQTEGL
jgi:hypothetical protein